MSAAMFLAMLTLFAAGVPIAIAIGLASALGIALFSHLPLLLVAQQLYIAVDKWPLVAVPFFILAGNLMEAGGISARLVDFAKAIVGGVQGGLAATCVLTCMIFAAISGSSVATTFAIGAILVPALLQHGYPRPFATALQAASAELGVIVPPSIPLILYGVSAEVSVGELFVAGIGPGLLIAGALMVLVLIWCRLRGYGRRDGVGRLGLVAATRRAGLALLMPAIVIGGIYGGMFTPTEASVVAVFYALVVGLLVYRDLRPRDLPAILRRSVLSSSVIMFIIATAGLFNFLITRAGVPAAIGDWITGHFTDRATFLLGVNAFLFMIGMFVETSASIIVLAPILAPLAGHFGVDPVQFGTIMVVNLALGMVTPPFGVNLFAACAVGEISLDRVVVWLLPFVAVVLACLMVVTYVPEISLTLRDLLYR
ncbi:MAG: TRAP transporter large permease subunit [Azospirillum sp.]|nr:TRAP transporter large permease subunit [Azospirillum sp.]